MEKAVLVIDMPTKCDECRFHYETYDENDYYVDKCELLDDMTIDGYLEPFILMPTSISQCPSDLTNQWVPGKGTSPPERLLEKAGGFTTPIPVVLSVCCLHWPQALPAPLLTSSEHCVWTSGNLLTLLSGEKSLLSCSRTLRILL